MKWRGKSYWKCSWVSEIRVSRKQQQTNKQQNNSKFNSNFELKIFLIIFEFFLFQLEVHRQVTLRTFMRKHNMETPPPGDLPPHVRHSHKRRSTTSHLDEKMEEQELTLLQAGVRPTALLIQRVINKRWVT